VICAGIAGLADVPRRQGGGFIERLESDTAAINLLRWVHTQGLPWTNHYLSGCTMPLERTCP
jgi:hypothetical protein